MLNPVQRQAAECVESTQGKAFTAGPVLVIADLGEHRPLILRNHGLLTNGESIPDAFLLMCVPETACQIQMMAQSGGSELLQVSKPILDGIVEQEDKVTKSLGGALAWPGLLRKLDRRYCSFRD
jgi:ribulose-5-phosphate 4-epimerase/fuculose-1-phosphate aldolase